MLKKFVFLIVVAFTLQLSWTMAGVYCLHDADKTTHHFGHHPHEHDSTKSESYSDKSSDKNTASHPDCASCACSSVGAFTSSFLFAHSLLNNDQFTEVSLYTPSPVSPKPERPKWMAFA
ncbi:MAG: hypothetical protein HY254_18925 [Burkholderiales bacterium]|nr:hypothetical protein [Burkholderiales bacterium]